MAKIVCITLALALCAMASASPVPPTGSGDLDVHTDVLDGVSGNIPSISEAGANVASNAANAIGAIVENAQDLDEDSAEVPGGPVTPAVIHTALNKDANAEVYADEEDSETDAGPDILMVDDDADRDNGGEAVDRSVDVAIDDVRNRETDDEAEYFPADGTGKSGEEGSYSSYSSESGESAELGNRKGKKPCIMKDLATGLLAAKVDVATAGVEAAQAAVSTGLQAANAVLSTGLQAANAVVSTGLNTGNALKSTDRDTSSRRVVGLLSAPLAGSSIFDTRNRGSPPPSFFSTSRRPASKS